MSDTIDQSAEQSPPAEHRSAATGGRLPDTVIVSEAGSETGLDERDKRTMQSNLTSFLYRTIDLGT
jgi:hypothetical protein